jgi:hypothetical protein
MGDVRHSTFVEPVLMLRMKFSSVLPNKRRNRVRKYLSYERSFRR